MLPTIIFLAILIILLLIRLYQKRIIIDEGIVLKNRHEMQILANQDWENGVIPQNQYRLLSTFFHPGFKNIWDYKPIETTKLRSEMYTLDSKFWSFYKVSPDFSIPPEVIYNLFKQYLLKQVDNYPLIKEKYQYNDNLDTSGIQDQSGLN